MVADAVGIPFEDVHVVSSQDTDVTPYGTGAYASRQTYIGGFSIMQTAAALRERILQIAHEQTRMPVSNLDLVDGKIIRKPDGRGAENAGRAGYREPVFHGAQPAHHGGDHRAD
jgi:xanthine dehydrogenase molybdenum-binding subunit